LTLADQRGQATLPNLQVCVAMSGLLVSRRIADGDSIISQLLYSCCCDSEFEATTLPPGTTKAVPLVDSRIPAKPKHRHA
jgi:hypothetical protein